jgi:hypothetical protein
LVLGTAKVLVFQLVPGSHSPATLELPPASNSSVGQSGHDPPQSTPNSLPFLTLSVQLAVAHLPAVHTKLWQSPPPLQSLLAGHAGHAGRPQLLAPPQSWSVSPPFCLPSLQLGGGPALHWLFLQVSVVVQALPSSHGALLAT